MAENQKSKVVNIKLWILILVVVGLWGLNFLCLFISKENRGLFGDMFGAVNSLFSGLAFSGLIYAIFLQRKDLAFQADQLVLQRAELALQRKELEMTRIELSRSATAQEHTELSLKKQTQAYIYSAIINGHNSFVTSLNNEISNTSINSTVTSRFATIGHRNEIEDHLAIIKTHLRLLDELKE